MLFNLPNYSYFKEEVPRLIFVPQGLTTVVVSKDSFLALSFSNDHRFKETAGGDSPPSGPFFGAILEQFSVHERSTTPLSDITICYFKQGPSLQAPVSLSIAATASSRIPVRR